MRLMDLVIISLGKLLDFRSGRYPAACQISLALRLLHLSPGDAYLQV